MEFQFFKLEIFVPVSHFPAVQKALQECDAGHIGQYDSCLSYSEVKSCWRPLPGASPYDGTIGRLSYETEYRVEAVCRAGQLDTALRAVKAAHPYEEPVINVIPLYRTGL